VEHLRPILDTMIGLALMEVIVKPVVVRYSKKLLKLADNHVKWIPDWLYKRPG
jgi:hypothetical protein